MRIFLLTYKNEHTLFKSTNKIQSTTWTNRCTTYTLSINANWFEFDTVFANISNDNNRQNYNNLYNSI